MHEASAAEAIIKMTTAACAERAASRVTRISLVVGEATGYMKESLAFYLGIFARGTPAEGAALDIRYVRPLLRCSACGAGFERRRFSFECPGCGGQGVATAVGSELYVDSIEVEEAP
jgi:hydrogenase nickel incorporation protein HypA/HybF